jgi:hypothetical protein
LIPWKKPEQTRNIDCETHARVGEEEDFCKRATTSIEPFRTTMRRLQTTVAADSSDPGFAPARNRMNNEMIEAVLSNSDHPLNFTIIPVYNRPIWFWHFSKSPSSASSIQGVKKVTSPRPISTSTQ